MIGFIAIYTLRNIESVIIKHFYILQQLTIKINKHNEKQTILEELILIVELSGSFSHIITKSFTACLVQLQCNKCQFMEVKHHFISCFSLCPHEY